MMIWVAARECQQGRCSRFTCGEAFHSDVDGEPAQTVESTVKPEETESTDTKRVPSFSQRLELLFSKKCRPLLLLTDRLLHLLKSIFLV